MDNLVDYHFFIAADIQETRSFLNMNEAWKFCDRAGYDEFCDVDSYNYMVANGTWRLWIDRFGE